MAIKGGKVEIEQRVNEIYTLLLSRANRVQILQYAANKWGKLGDRTVDSYIRKARELIQKDLSENRKASLAEHISTRNQLYQLALKREKLQTCLQILDSTAKLEGLYESLPKAIETVIAYGGAVTFDSNDNDRKDGETQSAFSDILGQAEDISASATATN